MDKSKIIKTSIFMIIIVALVGGYYYYLSNRNAKNNSQAVTEDKVIEEMTRVKEILAMADYKEYPSTPTQVVKYYNEITSCFYNETYSEEELIELARVARTLYDDELVANQSFEEYCKQLKSDIAVFKSGNITIYNSELTPATDVIYDTHHGSQWAKLYCMYTLKSGTVYQSSREEYLLRKDAEGHWKIYGFRLAVDPDN